MIEDDDIGIVGSVVATIIASAKKVIALQTNLVGLSAIGDGEVAKIIGGDGTVVAVVEFVRPFYLPVARQEEEFQLVVPRL